MIAIVILAALVTAAALVALGLADPKRTRVSGGGKTPPLATRRALVALAIVPGVVLAILGEGAGFMIWLGAAGVMGWAVTALLSAWSRARSTKSKLFTE